MKILTILIAVHQLMLFDLVQAYCSNSNIESKSFNSLDVLKNDTGNSDGTLIVPRYSDGTYIFKCSDWYDCLSTYPCKYCTLDMSSCDSSYVLDEKFVPVSGGDGYLQVKFDTSQPDIYCTSTSSPNTRINLLCTTNTDGSNKISSEDFKFVLNGTTRPNYSNLVNSGFGAECFLKDYTAKVYMDYNNATFATTPSTSHNHDFVKTTPKHDQKLYFKIHLNWNYWWCPGKQFDKNIKVEAINLANSARTPAPPTCSNLATKVIANSYVKGESNENDYLVLDGSEVCAFQFALKVTWNNTVLTLNPTGGTFDVRWWDDPCPATKRIANLTSTIYGPLWAKRWSTDYIVIPYFSTYFTCDPKTDSAQICCPVPTFYLTKPVDYSVFSCNVPSNTSFYSPCPVSMTATQVSQQINGTYYTANNSMVLKVDTSPYAWTFPITLGATWQISAILGGSPTPFNKEVQSSIQILYDYCMDQDMRIVFEDDDLKNAGTLSRTWIGSASISTQKLSINTHYTSQNLARLYYPNSLDSSNEGWCNKSRVIRPTDIVVTYDPSSVNVTQLFSTALVDFTCGSNCRSDSYYFDVSVTKEVTFTYKIEVCVTSYMPNQFCNKTLNTYTINVQFLDCSATTFVDSPTLTQSILQDYFNTPFLKTWANQEFFCTNTATPACCSGPPSLQIVNLAVTPATVSPVVSDRLGSPIFNGGGKLQLPIEVKDVCQLQFQVQAMWPAGTRTSGLLIFNILPACAERVVNMNNLTLTPVNVASFPITANGASTNQPVHWSKSNLITCSAGGKEKYCCPDNTYSCASPCNSSIQFRYNNIEWRINDPISVDAGYQASNTVANRFMLNSGNHWFYESSNITYYLKVITTELVEFSYVLNFLFSYSGTTLWSGTSAVQRVHVYDPCKDTVLSSSNMSTPVTVLIPRSVVQTPIWQSLAQYKYIDCDHTALNRSQCCWPLRVNAKVDWLMQNNLTWISGATDVSYANRIAGTLSFVQGNSSLSSWGVKASEIVKFSWTLQATMTGKSLKVISVPQVYEVYNACTDYHVNLGNMTAFTFSFPCSNILTPTDQPLIWAKNTYPGCGAANISQGLCCPEDTSLTYAITTGSITKISGASGITYADRFKLGPFVDTNQSLMLNVFTTEVVKFTFQIHTEMTSPLYAGAKINDTTLITVDIYNPCLDYSILQTVVTGEPFVTNITMGSAKTLMWPAANVPLCSATNMSVCCIDAIKYTNTTWQISDIVINPIYSNISAETILRLTSALTFNAISKQLSIDVNTSVPVVFTFKIQTTMNTKFSATPILNKTDVHTVNVSDPCWDRQIDTSIMIANTTDIQINSSNGNVTWATGTYPQCIATNYAMCCVGQPITYSVVEITKDSGSDYVSISSVVGDRITAGPLIDGSQNLVVTAKLTEHAKFTYKIKATLNNFPLITGTSVAHTLNIWDPCFDMRIDVSTVSANTYELNQNVSVTGQQIRWLDPNFPKCQATNQTCCVGKSLTYSFANIVLDSSYSSLSADSTVRFKTNPNIISGSPDRLQWKVNDQEFVNFIFQIKVDMTGFPSKTALTAIQTVRIFNACADRIIDGTQMPTNPLIQDWASTGTFAKTLSFSANEFIKCKATNVTSPYKCCDMMVNYTVTNLVILQSPVSVSALVADRFSNLEPIQLNQTIPDQLVLNIKKHEIVKFTFKLKAWLVDWPDVSAESQVYTVNVQDPCSSVVLTAMGQKSDWFIYNAAPGSQQTIIHSSPHFICSADASNITYGCCSNNVVLRIRDIAYLSASTGLEDNLRILNPLSTTLANQFSLDVNLTHAVNFTFVIEAELITPVLSKKINSSTQSITMYNCDESVLTINSSTSLAGKYNQSYPLDGLLTNKTLSFSPFICDWDFCCKNISYSIDASPNPTPTFIALTETRDATTSLITQLQLVIKTDSLNQEQIKIKARVGTKVHLSDPLDVQIFCADMQLNLPYIKPDYSFFLLETGASVNFVNGTCTSVLNQAQCCDPNKIIYEFSVINTSVTDPAANISALNATGLSWDQATYRFVVGINTSLSMQYEFQIVMKSGHVELFSPVSSVKIECSNNATELTPTNPVSLDVSTSLRNLTQTIISFSTFSCLPEACCQNMSYYLNILDTNSSEDLEAIRHLKNSLELALANDTKLNASGPTIDFIVNTDFNFPITFKFVLKANVKTAPALDKNVSSSEVTVALLGGCLLKPVTWNQNLAADIEGNVFVNFTNPNGGPKLNSMFDQGTEVFTSPFIFRIAQRFISDIDCPIGNYTISKVENLLTSTTLSKGEIGAYFQVNPVNVEVTVSVSLKEVSDFLVTFNASNGQAWYKGSSNYQVKVKEAKKATTQNETKKEKVPEPQQPKVEAKKEEPKKEEPKPQEKPPTAAPFGFKPVKVEYKHPEIPFVPAKEVEKKPVKLQVVEIKRQGNCTIQFNQPLIIPGFFTTAKLNSKNKKAREEKAKYEADAIALQEEIKRGKTNIRKLQEEMLLENIDVNADILKVYLTVNSDDENSQHFDFFPQLIDWTENNIVIQLNFTTPEFVSVGKNPDQIYFKIVNPDMFTSLTGMKPATEVEKTVMPANLPKLLPHNIDEDSLRTMAKNAMGVVVFVQVALAFCIKSAIKRMWQLFFFLQMFCSLIIFKISYPVNADIVIENLRGIIFFEILKPEKLLPMIGLNLDIDQILGIEKTDLMMNGAGAESTNSLKNLRTYLLMAGVGLACVILMCIIACMFRCFRECLVKRIKSIAKGFYWNNTIKALYISFLPQCISVTGAMILGLRVKKEGINRDTLINIGMLVACFVIPTLFAWWLNKHKNELRGNKTLEGKFAELWFEVRLPFKDVYPNAIFYAPVFLLRRAIYTCIPLIFFNSLALQLVFLAGLLIGYQMWLAHNNCLAPQSQQRILLFNEFFLSVTVYCMFYLLVETEFYRQYTGGYVFLGVPLTVVIFNIGSIATEELAKKGRIEDIKNFKIQNLRQIILDRRAKRAVQRQAKKDQEKRHAKQREENKVKMEKENIIETKTFSKKPLKPVEIRTEQPVDTKLEQDKEDVFNAYKLKVLTQNKEIKLNILNLEENANVLTKMNLKGVKEVYASKEVKRSEAPEKIIQKDTPDIKKQRKDSKADAKKETIEPKIEEKQVVMNYEDRDANAMIQAEMYLPPNPDHFEVYPSVLPKDIKSRKIHTKIVQDLEAKYLNIKGGKMKQQFEREKVERELIRMKQKQINLELEKKVHAIQPKWNFNYVNAKIMDEKSCVDGSLEYEIEYTIIMVGLYQKGLIKKQDKERRQK